MEQEEWTTMEYCSRCRDHHEVTEDAGTWVCGGQRPVINTEIKKLDRIMQDPGLQSLTRLGGETNV